MNRTSMSALLAAGVALAGSFTASVAQQPGSGTDQAQAVAARPAATAGRAAVTRYYSVVREQAPLDGYTLYRPLAPAATKLPVVIWANGGCRTSNEEFQTFLGQVAARGFAVVAIGNVDARFTPAAGADRSARPLIKAIDWVSQRARGNDVRRGFDASRIAVMGQSCGGVQALAAGADDRVDSVVAWNGSTGLGATNTAVLNALHSPTMWVTGGPSDVAYAAANADFAAAPADLAAFYVENSAAGHIGIFHGTNDPKAAKAGAPELGQEVEVVGSTLAVQWLDATLNGNLRAARYFTGANCGVCGEPYWSAASN